MPIKRKSYVENGRNPIEKEGRFNKVDPRILFRECALIRWLEMDPSKTTVLTRDEERALIEKYRGDRKKLNEQLVLHNTRAACSIAKRYANSTGDFDDLIARAMCGLVYAAERFDIDSGNRFLTYATNWIFNWIQREYYSKGRKIFNDTTVSITRSDWDTEDDVNPENSLIHMVPEEDRNKYIHQMEREWNDRELLKVVKDLLQLVDGADGGFDELDRAIFHAKLWNGDNQQNNGEKVTFKSLSRQFNVPLKTVKERRDGLCERLRTYVTKKYGIRDVADILN